MKYSLAENMRRFATKNLSEQPIDPTRQYSTEPGVPDTREPQAAPAMDPATRTRNAAAMTQWALGYVKANGFRREENTGRLTFTKSTLRGAIEIEIAGYGTKRPDLTVMVTRSGMRTADPNAEYLYNKTFTAADWESDKGRSIEGVLAPYIR